ncbi:uncharacterized protein LOC141901001 [Tubulanus polymorphus]|uniref:uncharacterized protein LOC141901001 n=1 Tax=Tubulanus polymorphus TaxID=672921 RepID=UPI003DA3DA3A
MLLLPTELKYQGGDFDLLKAIKELFVRQTNPLQDVEKLASAMASYEQLYGLRETVRMIRLGMIRLPQAVPRSETLVLVTGNDLYYDKEKIKVVTDIIHRLGIQVIIVGPSSHVTSVQDYMSLMNTETDMILLSDDFGGLQALSDPIFTAITQHVKCPEGFYQAGTSCKRSEAVDYFCQLADGQKYAAGSSWTTRSCYTWSCTSAGPVVTSYGCRNARGQCLPIGSSNFVCIVDGVWYSSCRCTYNVQTKSVQYTHS